MAMPLPATEDKASQHSRNQTRNTMPLILESLLPATSPRGREERDAQERPSGRPDGMHGTPPTPVTQGKPAGFNAPCGEITSPTGLKRGTVRSFVRLHCDRAL
jgi:hypothetical protein